MTEKQHLDEAHRRVKELAMELSKEGISDTAIIDALMATGSNAYARMEGAAKLGATLRQVADEIETRGRFTGQQN